MKILVIRFSSIGDVLLTTPVVRCLKRQLRGCEVHVLTKQQNAALFNGNPYVDRVVVLPQSPMDTASSAKTRGSGLSLLMTSLQAEHYDAVVDLHNNHRSRYVRRRLRRSGCGNVMVYRKENFHKFLYILTKHDFMTGAHVVDRYLAAVAPLGVVADGGGLDLFVSPADEGENSWHRDIALYGRPYVVIACGAQHATKRLPDEVLPLLANHLAEDPNPRTAVLVGGADDAIRIGSIAMPANVVNLCGRTTLPQVARVIQGASAVITPDSAMLHFASALNVPVVAVWGSTVPSFGFSPYAVQHTNFQVPLSCRPCSRAGRDRCPLGHFKCMALQNWKAIADQTDKR